MPGLAIGELATAAACNTASIRYYEDIGLLPKAGRRSGGHRTYGKEDVARLVFIRRCREFGFSIPQIKELIGISAEAPCEEARQVAQARLDAVRVRLAETKQLEAALSRFVARCEASCCGGPLSDCTLIDDLGGSTRRRA
jgi:DNA-binding transcriptional MerR regulator